MAPSSPHFVSCGAGEPILCLHGIGSSSESFRPQLEGLSSAYRVVAWDAPGYGRSADPPAAPGLHGYAQAAADLIAELGEAAHVVGVSWGGAIALDLALRHPESVRSLVLISASRGSGRDPQRAADMRDRSQQLAMLGGMEFARRRAPRLLAPDAPAELVDAVTRNMADSLRVSGLACSAASMADTDLSARLGAVSVPTLVICGIEDEVTGPVESSALAAGIPGAAMVSIPGAGHLVNQEAPETVNAWIAAFARLTNTLTEASAS